MVIFGKYPQDQYFLSLEMENAVRAAIFQAFKDELPKEARRVDVLCYLLDEAKDWVKMQSIL